MWSDMENPATSRERGSQSLGQPLGPTLSELSWSRLICHWLTATQKRNGCQRHMCYYNCNHFIIKGSHWHVCTIPYRCEHSSHVWNMPHTCMPHSEHTSNIYAVHSAYTTYDIYYTHHLYVYHTLYTYAQDPCHICCRHSAFILHTSDITMNSTLFTAVHITCMTC